MSADVLSGFACWICYQPQSAVMRYDRHGRPYVTCEACGMRTFTKGPRFIKGMGLTIALVEQVIARGQRDPVARAADEATAHAFVETVHAQLERAAEGASNANGAAQPAEESHVGSVSIAAAAAK